MSLYRLNKNQLQRQHSFKKQLVVGCAKRSAAHHSKQSTSIKMHHATLR